MKEILLSSLLALCALGAYACDCECSKPVKKAKAKLIQRTPRVTYGDATCCPEGVYWDAEMKYPIDGPPPPAVAAPKQWVVNGAY